VIWKPFLFVLILLVSFFVMSQFLVKLYGWIFTVFYILGNFLEN
jgi:hypothetical protein